MRIACFVNRFPMISEQFILNQITGLIDRGHDVDVYATLPGDAAGLHPDLVEYRLLERTRFRHSRPGRRVRRVLRGARLLAGCRGGDRAALLRTLDVARHGRAALSLDLLFQAASLLEAAPYDISHFHFGQAGLFGVRLREVGVLTGRLVTTFYGCDVSRHLRTHGPDVYAPLVRHGDLFICITDDMRDRLVAAGFPRAQIVKVMVGIDLRRFAMRERTLRPGEPVRLLTVGRLVEKKGIEGSIRAVGEIVRSRPDVHYRIVGDGPLRPRLEALVETLGLGRWIELTGWKSQDEVRACFAEAHIFVLASRTAPDGDEEGLPGVLKEAQAMGLPVVSTRHSGIPEGVLDGRSGLLVPEGDVAALAGALRYLIDHPDRWPAMGQAGRRHIEEHGDIETLNDQLVQAYASVLAAEAA
jgi:colanic acid/amylovoran biosynthesis glycosyltransferase